MPSRNPSLLRQHGAVAPRRQRGAALLTAMIIVTLVATLAAAMVWQQWRAIQVEASERARAQSAWILYGALDFAKHILQQDTKQYTALTEPWATPLAESRLSTFLAVDKSSADDGPEAFLSGNIEDAQARYNLTNLLKGVGEPDPDQVAILGNLCEAVGIETSVAGRIAEGLRTGAKGKLPPKLIDQLTWFGLDPASVQALKPYVVLLPNNAVINVNTASKEVLSAVIGIEGGTAQNVLQVRQRTPFRTVEEFVKLVPAATKLTTRFIVRSDFFEVRGRLRLADRVLVERSLLQREGRGQRSTFKVINHERIASLEQLGG